MLSIILLLSGAAVFLAAILLGILWLVKSKRRQPATGMKIGFFISLSVAIVALVAGWLTYCPHNWKSATCKKPKTCRLCDATEGEPRDHKWKSATCTEPKTCTYCDKTRGEALDHSWTDATCTEAEHCTRCDLTEGIALGHDWKDGSCIEPRTCKRCQDTEGTAPGHDWKDATCTEAQKCTVCTMTYGEPLGHTPGETEAEEPDYITGTYEVCQRCTTCDEILDRSVEALDSLHENGNFILSPNQFTDRIDAIFDKMDSNMSATMIITDNNEMGCVIYSGSTLIATVLFSDGENILTGSEQDADHAYNVIWCSYETEDSELLAESLIRIVAACNPGLTTTEAGTLASDILVAATTDSDIYYHDDLGYAASVYDGVFRLIIGIDNR